MDCTSASWRRGQTVYAFWVQSVFESVASAWRIEARRMRRLDVRVLSIRNRMIIYTAFSALLVVALYIYSPVSLIAFVAQSVIAFSLLEVVNYVEHYGLERRCDGKR
ncbi:MAG: fatty acid desaturase [Spirochaetales bacterium]